MCSPFYNWTTLTFLNFIYVHAGPSADHQLQFMFSYLGINSHGSFHSLAHYLVNHDFLYSPVFFSSHGSGNLP